MATCTIGILFYLLFPIHGGPFRPNLSVFDCNLGEVVNLFDHLLVDGSHFVADIAMGIEILSSYVQIIMYSCLLNLSFSPCCKVPMGIYKNVSFDVKTYPS